MHLTRNKVGPDVWESWPVEAREVIIQLEAIITATRTTLRVSLEELHQHSDLMTSHPQDIARKMFKELVKDATREV